MGSSASLYRWLLHGFLKTWCFVVERWKGHEDGDCQPLGMISLDQLGYLSGLYFSNISLRCKKGLQGCLYFFLSVWGRCVALVWSQPEGSHQRGSHREQRASAGCLPSGTCSGWQFVPQIMVAQ